MKKVIAVIISFNDTNALKKTVSAIKEQVHKTIIIDNGSSDEFQGDLCEFDEIEKVVCKRLDKNYGIATALNIGIEAAKKDGAEWVVTLDQDSIAAKGFVEKLLAISNMHPKAGVIAPLLDPRKTDENYVEDMDAAITSGNLVRVEIFENIRYRDEYFIDSVDFEFCLNVRKKGWRIKGVGGNWLSHRLGKKKLKKILSIPFAYIEHSPIRRYYIFRNSIHLARDYGMNFPVFITKKTVFLAKALLVIMLLDDEKKENAVKIFQGVVDGFCGRYGSYESCRE